MDSENHKTLEEQASILYLKLHQLIQVECLGSEVGSTSSVRKERLNLAHAHAYVRLLRRQQLSRGY